ncbi:FAD/NAD(P)-binding domain-containing protein [Artomyces pyxidatus]|uniref:FAD/NAD(P)-binding domain-containing protein n=1 Tax=Artomyces pyxidatus TaxID=48021 RepID=A0ACB8SQT3_9AGAM|nr:FAD/NAD(P)-binding domain-containing protein [Artomyces pyxidatus]
MSTALSGALFHERTILNQGILTVAEDDLCPRRARRDGFSDVLVLTRDRTVGGVWAEERVYPGLRVNSGELSFSSLAMPLPKGSSGVISGGDMRAYLEAFAEGFLAGKVRFETENTRAAETLVFARIVLCSGGCSTPTIPAYLAPEAAKAANFSGPVLHSMDFRAKLDELHSSVTPESGSVVVVGGGKSAQDAATYLANAGIPVTIVFEAVDCCIAAWFPLPAFIRKSRFMSVMSPNIELNTRLDVFSTRPGSARSSRAHSGSSYRIFLSRRSVYQKKSPLRNTHFAFWSIRLSDERVAEVKRFHHLVKTGKISFAAPARMERYGDEGKSVVLSDGRVLQADAVVLAYASSWDCLFEGITIPQECYHRLRRAFMSTRLFLLSSPVGSDVRISTAANHLHLFRTSGRVLF